MCKLFHKNSPNLEIVHLGTFLSYYFVCFLLPLLILVYYVFNAELVFCLSINCSRSVLRKTISASCHTNR